MDGRFFRCTDCDELICFTQYDTVPEYEFLQDKGDFVEIYSNERTSFINEHSKHRVEELKINKDSFVREGSYTDPMGEGYIEATNGREDFVIRRWRKGVNAPYDYQLIRGRIKVRVEKIEVQKSNIRKQMEFDFGKMPVSKIDAFISVYEKMVSYMDPGWIEIELFETDSPALCFGKGNNEMIKKLMEVSEEIFSGEELKNLNQFILDNNSYDGVITLMVTRQFKIIRTKKRRAEIVKFPPKEELIDIRKVG